jgi:hypothetical protein
MEILIQGVILQIKSGVLILVEILTAIELLRKEQLLLRKKLMLIRVYFIHHHIENNHVVMEILIQGVILQIKSGALILVKMRTAIELLLKKQLLMRKKLMLLRVYFGPVHLEYKHNPKFICHRVCIQLKNETVQLIYYQI